MAFIVLYYGNQLIKHERVRRTTMLLFTLAFLFAGVAGLFGALITKVAPSASQTGVETMSQQDIWPAEAEPTPST